MTSESSELFLGCLAEMSVVIDIAMKAIVIAFLPSQFDSLSSP